jgi:hypothetical protein
MANITVGSSTTSVFITDSILPGLAPNTFPTGVTGLGTVNYTTGARTFTLNANSAVYIENENIAPATPDAIVAGFAVRGNGSWGVTVNGTINALNTYVSQDEGDEGAIFGNGVGIALGNAAATVVSTINVVTEGSIFGNSAGIVSATFMNVTNAGLIGGGGTGILISAGALASSNLDLTAAGVAKTITISNAATGEIFGNQFGISNNSESNLVVTNAGLIAGGDTSLIVGDDGIDFDASEFGFAVQSAGRLTLTNSATGVIDGTVYSDWAGSAVTNAGKIYGTVVAQINREYVQDTASAKLDANRDGDFSDATDYLITDVRLIGTTITNSGVIDGGNDYLVEAVTVNEVLGFLDEGFPTLVDSAGNTVLFDEDGVPHYELEEPVEIATFGDAQTMYYNAEGSLMAGAPADWEPVFEEDVLTGFTDTNGVFTSAEIELPLAYADESAQLVIQFQDGNINAPFYTTLQSIFYYDDPTAEDFETPDGDTVNLVFRDDEYVVITSSTMTEERQIAIDGSMLRDVITNAAAGIIYGDVTTADGSDSFTNAGQLIGTAEMGDGNDTFINAATGKVFAARGDFGRFDSVELGRGNDTATIAGSVYGGVDLGEGNDTITVSGNVFGNLDAESGADSVTIGATGQVTGSVFLNDGNNALTNSGSIGSNIFQGEATAISGVIGLVGNDFLTNTATGTIEYGVDLGGGADRIINSGAIYSDYRDLVAVDTGLGNDTLTNSGIIGSEFAIFTDNRISTANIFAELDDGFDVSLAVDMGVGADLLTNFAGKVQGNIYGIISMGAGNDTVIGGANSEYVLDDAGSDQYRLGAGADAFIVDSPDNSVDVFDGGTGLNLIAFILLEEGPSEPPSDAEPLGHRIDLAAGRITYAIDSFNDTISNGSFAVDTITNVQQVVGSDGGDVILGGALAESLDGGEGDDTISGGGGRDLMFGDDGADVFVFTAAAHSGLTRGTRDVIGDFSNEDGDQIALNFDSNTRTGTAGNNAANEFVFLGNNVGFTGNNYVEGGIAQNYAEVRTLMQAGMTLVEVDTNGDKRADFSFALRGFHELEQDDFFGSNFVSLIG